MKNMGRMMEATALEGKKKAGKRGAGTVDNRYKTKEEEEKATRKEKKDRKKCFLTHYSPFISYLAIYFSRKYYIKNTDSAYRIVIQVKHLANIVFSELSLSIVITCF